MQIKERIKDRFLRCFNVRLEKSGRISKGVGKGVNREMGRKLEECSGVEIKYRKRIKGEEIINCV